MDFSNRVQQHPAAAGPQVSSGAGEPAKRGRGGRSTKGWRIASVGLLFGIVVLVVAVLLLIHFNGNGEYGYVNTGTFQAVDINVAGSSSDQIYFGNIKAINDGYLILENVYYIPSSESNSSISLQPLVCLVDAPYNRMVINRASVNWWENLRSDGQVAKAISNYQKSSNPSCSSSSSPSSSSSSNTSANSSTSNTSPNSSNTTSSTNSSTTNNTPTSTGNTGTSTTNNSSTKSSTTK